MTTWSRVLAAALLLACKSGKDKDDGAGGDEDPRIVLLAPL